VAPSTPPLACPTSTSTSASCSSNSTMKIRGISSLGVLFHMSETFPPNPSMNPRYFKHLHVLNFIYKIFIISYKTNKVTTKCIYITMLWSYFMYDLEIKISQHVNPHALSSIKGLWLVLNVKWFMCRYYLKCITFPFHGMEMAMY